MPGPSRLLLAAALAITAAAGTLSLGSAGAQEPCPVDREICDFGEQALEWVRAIDAESLVAGSTWDNANDIAIVRGSLEANGHGPGTRLTAYGCAIVEGRATWDRAFSLVFVNPAGQDLAGEGAIEVIGFWRDGGAGRPALNTLAAVDGIANRRAALEGGRVEQCWLSGLIPPTDQECILTEFFVVGTEAPSPPDVGTGTRPGGGDRPAPLAAALAGFAVVAGGAAVIGYRRRRRA